MKHRKICIQAAEQISVQQPLSSEWMRSPIAYRAPYVRSVDPDFKKFFSPSEARRIGKMLKRALVTSLEVIRKSGVTHPAAIITGTGLGCIENTELFLDALCREGERLLKPTYFMQSTHNTIGSLIGIYTKTYGYNVTYAHKGISFDSALLDAWTQFGLGLIDSALVGGHDEMTPSYFTLLQKTGFVGRNEEIGGECAVSVMLNGNARDGLCFLSGIKLIYKPTVRRLQTMLSGLLAEAGITMRDVDAVMTGISGNKSNDACYRKVASELFGDIPLLHFKRVFCESYTASGLGLYAAACCLRAGVIPRFLYIDQAQAVTHRPRFILLFNQCDGKNYSFILLEALCGN